MLSNLRHNDCFPSKPLLQGFLGWKSVVASSIAIHILQRNFNFLQRIPSLAKSHFSFSELKVEVFILKP